MHLFTLNLYLRLQTVLYLHSDSIHHSYLNKTGKVTVTKFNMNMVRKALNLMLVRQQLSLPIILPILFNNNLITTECSECSLDNMNFKIELKIKRNTYIFPQFRTSHRLPSSTILKLLCNLGCKGSC